MTVYYVGNKEFFSLSCAKLEMRKTGNKGYKIKVYSNGDWVNMGEIKLNSSNKAFIANSRMKRPNY